MDHSINDTSFRVEACSFNLDFKITVTILLGTTFLFSISENIVVSVVICVDRKLRRPSNGYLLSLALTDICISLMLIPIQMIFVWWYPKWPLGSKGANIFSSFWLFSVASSFVTLLVITVDRYRAVMSLVRYREVASWGRTLVIIALVWFYVLIVVVLMYVFALDPISEVTYEWNVNYKFYYPFLALHIVVPMMIMIALYFKIYKKAQENRQQLLLHGGQINPGTTTASSETVRETRIEVRMAKTVGFVFLFLVMVWIPVLILEIFYAVRSQTSCIIEHLGVISLWMNCSNGVINPVVYSLRNKDFQRAILQLIRCKRSERPEARTSSS